MTATSWPPCLNHRAPRPVDGPTACDCGRVTRHPAPPKETPAVLINRTTRALHAPAAPLLTAECVQCGDTFEAYTPAHPRTGVDHRCATATVGAVWVLLEAPEVGRARALHRIDSRFTLEQHLEAIDVAQQAARLDRRRLSLEAVPA